MTDESASAPEAPPTEAPEELTPEELTPEELTPDAGPFRPPLSVAAAAPPSDADYLIAAERAHAAAAKDPRAGDPFAFPAAGTPEAQDLDEQMLRDERRFREQSIGPEVPRGERSAQEYIDPIDAFLSPKAKELPVKHLPLPRLGTVLHLRAIDTPRYSALVDQYTVVRRDKETGERVETTKDRELRAQLIIESVVNVPWNDDRLYIQFDLVDRQGRPKRDPHALVERMFLPGEVAQLAEYVHRISGGEGIYLEEQAKGF